MSSKLKIHSHKPLHILSLGRYWSSQIDDISLLTGFSHRRESKNRLAMFTFWRTFHHDGKYGTAQWGSARPPPFTLFTITQNVVVYAPAERADIYSSTIFSSVVSAHREMYLPLPFRGYRKWQRLVLEERDQDYQYLALCVYLLTAAGGNWMLKWANGFICEVWCCLLFV
jgi:hypothetical protein